MTIPPELGISGWAVDNKPSGARLVNAARQGRTDLRGSIVTVEPRDLSQKFSAMMRGPAYQREQTRVIVRKKIPHP